MRRRGRPGRRDRGAAARRGLRGRAGDGAAREPRGHRRLAPRERRRGRRRLCLRRGRAPGGRLLRAGLLRVSASAPEVSWDAVAARLRPFVRARVASEADAEDVLQEVLLRMLRGLPALQQKDRLGAWMYRIAHSAVADHGRARARHPLASHEPPEPVAVEAVEEDAEVAHAVAGVLGLFVAALPEPYREAVTLTDLEGRTQREAAALLGLSLSGMKSRVQRGRAKLRSMLEACCELGVDARGRVVSCEVRRDGELPPGCCAD
ncbi:MAG: sigma-70 family RNA polymerase sigma factor [Deltaproteobacteria bacterium]|nr:MAG: sigma-70 family RNA polymerase sigma factor [Deltaproteobacteria bacterium]